MRIRKYLAVVAALALAMTTMAGLAGCSSSKSITKPALVSRVTKYEIDYDTGEWREKLNTEFEYENAYPVRIAEYDHDTEEETVQTFQYEFNGETPVEAVIFNGDGVQTHLVTYTEEGWIDRI